MKSLLKKIFPLPVRNRIREMLERLNVLLIRLFAKNSFLASVYYAFFSRQFYREHKAVLQGRLAYHQSLLKVGESCVLLRRNVHRLEKGLIMQPRRDIFADGYITETVDCLETAMKSDVLCESELKWAIDVLSSYFSVVGSQKNIDESRAKFLRLTEQSEKPSFVPYPHGDLPASPVDYDQLVTLFTRRRSVRWYQQKTVDMDVIRQAVRAATLAPSACNRQPFEFFVVNDQEKATDIADCAMGTAGFANNLPCIIAVVGNLNAYPAERDRHVIYIDGSLAAMQLMLACETLGLSTCPINWPDIEQREKLLSQKLGLNYHERTVMLLAVGYAEPEGGIPFSQKKSDKVLLKEVI